MRRITLAVLAWVALGIVGAWAHDAASHSAGRLGHLGNLIPAWVLFELWAIGFVLLATIGIKGLGDIKVASTARPPRRKTIWAMVAWTVVWIVLVGIWALDPAGTFVGNGPGSGGPIDLKPPDFVLFDAWALGVLVLGSIWLVARLWSARHRGSVSAT